MRIVLRNLLWWCLLPFTWIFRDSKAVILMYHSTEIPGAFFNVTPTMLEWQFAYLRRRGYRLVLISELLEMTKRRKSLRNIVAITFDDGHKDFITTVLPLAKCYAIPITLYWSAGIPQGILRTSDGFDCPILSDDQIKQISGNPRIEIAGHGMTHRLLYELTIAECRTELVESKMKIEALTGSQVASLAYPSGKYSKKVLALIEDIGYECGVTVHEDRVNHLSDPWILPRVAIDSAVPRIGFMVKLSPVFTFYKKIQRYWGSRRVNPLWVYCNSILRRTTIYRTLFHVRIAKHCKGIEGRILDLASGPKPSYYRYLPSMARYIKTDYTTTTAIDEVVDFNKPLGFEDNSFEAVFLFNSLYISETPKDLLKEIHRVLVPGGKVYVVSPFAANYMPDPHDFARYTPESLCRFLQGAGFTLVIKDSFGERVTTALYALNPLVKTAIVRFVVYSLALFFDMLIPRNVKKLHPFPLGYFYVGQK